MQPPLGQWRTWWQRRGLRELEELLLVWWDPCGVYGEPEAQDEYESYVPRLATLLRAGAREAEVAEHLRALETAEIGAAGESELAAARIVAWHDHVVASLPGVEPPA
jgi:hypothetical protein